MTTTIKIKFVNSAAAAEALARMNRQDDGPGMSYAAARKQAEAWKFIFDNKGVRLIDAIKKAREITGLGLKEAKDLVETL